MAQRAQQAIVCLREAVDFVDMVPHGLSGEKAFACCNDKYYISGHDPSFPSNTLKGRFMRNFETVHQDRIAKLISSVGLQPGMGDHLVHAEKKAAADERAPGDPIGVTRPICGPRTRYSPDCQSLFKALARSNRVFEILADSSEFLGKRHSQLNSSFIRVWIFSPKGRVYRLLHRTASENKLQAQGIYYVDTSSLEALYEAAHAVLLLEGPP